MKSAPHFLGGLADYRLSVIDIDYARTDGTDSSLTYPSAVDTRCACYFREAYSEVKLSLKFKVSSPHSQ